MHVTPSVLFDYVLTHWLRYTRAKNAEQMKRWYNTDIIHDILISCRKRNEQNLYASLCNAWICILIVLVSQLWLVND